MSCWERALQAPSALSTLSWGPAPNVCIRATPRELSLDDASDRSTLTRGRCSGRHGVLALPQPTLALGLQRHCPNLTDGADGWAWPPPPALPFWCQTPSRSHGHPGPRWFSLTQTPPQMRSLHMSSHLELHFSEDTEHPSALRMVRTPGAACLRAQLHTSSRECPATRARRTWQSLRAGILSPRGLCCTHPCESPLLPRAGHSERRVLSASFAPSGAGWGSRNLSLSCTPHSHSASSQGHC